MRTRLRVSFLVFPLALAACGAEGSNGSGSGGVAGQSGASTGGASTGGASTGGSSGSATGGSAGSPSGGAAGSDGGASSAWPGADDTGVPSGTTLTSMNGNLHVTNVGEVVEGLDILGCVIVEAPNVTIKNCKITCDFGSGIASFESNYSGGGLVIEDTEVSCADTTATGISGYGFVARRTNVHGCENGFSVEHDVTVEDSYIHTLIHGTDGHTDGIQIVDGAADITIRHNTILNDDAGGTSAIIGDTGSHERHLITDNVLAGGSYTLYCPKDGDHDNRVTFNRFSRQFHEKGGFNGPWVYCDGVTEVHDNVWDDTGAPLDP